MKEKTINRVIIMLIIISMLAVLGFAMGAAIAICMPQ